MTSGCAPLLTQSPGKGLSPVNAVNEGEDKHLMLFGHDVVSYFTEKTHRKADPAIKSVFQRARRLIFRVPLYKTGEDLAAEVARARK